MARPGRGGCPAGSSSGAGARTRRTPLRLAHRRSFTAVLIMRPQEATKAAAPAEAGSGHPRTTAGNAPWLSKMTELPTMPTGDDEEDSPLAAMITAVADGQILTRHDKDRLRLLMVDQALGRRLTWNMIAVAFGYPSGKRAKKIIHGLRTRVQRAERLSSRP